MAASRSCELRGRVRRRPWLRGDVRLVALECSCYGDDRGCERPRRLVVTLGVVAGSRRSSDLIRGFAQRKRRRRPCWSGVGAARVVRRRGAPNRGARRSTPPRRARLRRGAGCSGARTTQWQPSGRAPGLMVTKASALSQGVTSRAEVRSRPGARLATHERAATQAPPLAAHVVRERVHRTGVTMFGRTRPQAYARKSSCPRRMVR
jgi:hypothetical protein